MATPAAQSIRQRYRAGDYTLDVTLQPSSLSQWYPQPIVDRAQFQLWMRQDEAGDNEAPVLLAEGDRTDLQMIARYIEHRTRAAITLPRNSKEDAQSVPPLPLGCHLPEPLGYLHLCDLSSVLDQYEQATASLPVNLEVATAPSRATARVIPLSTNQGNNTQGASTRGTSTRGNSTAAARRKDPNRNGLLLPFRSRRTVWAGSAAAALFAVGLTTFMWNQSSAPTARSVADADLEASELGGSTPDRLSLNQGEKPDRSASSARSARLSDRLSGDSTAPAADAVRPSGNPALLRHRNAAGSRGPDATPPAIATSPSATSAEPETGTTAPAQTGTNDNQLDQSVERSETADSAERENVVVTVPPLADNTVSAQTPDNALEPGNVSGSENASDNALDRVIAQAESDMDRSTISRLPEVESSTADLPVLSSAEPPSSARSQNDAIALARRAPLSTSEEILASSSSASVQEAETMALVRKYFSRQWSPNASLQAPLSYRLQLSEFGEIVSFSALTEAGGRYRDRLLPDRSISFPPSNSAGLGNGLTLTITVSADGQVQVQKP